MEQEKPAEILVTLPIEPGKIREFARAILDDNPIYRSAKEAASAGFQGIPAPPTYSVVSAFFQESGSRLDVGLDMRYTLHAEQEYEYHIPVVAGDILTGRSRITNRYEKEGRRGGKLVFVTVETVYENQIGQKVLTVRQTLVQTSKTAEK